MRCASYSLAALLLAFAVSLCYALHIESNGLSPVVAPLPHETLEKLFIVTAGDDASEAITFISSSALQQVYVSYREAQSPGQLATVRVIGGSALTNHSGVTVSATDGKPGQLRIASNMAAYTSDEYIGRLRVEVQVHTVKKLQRLETIGGGDIVVEAPELFVNSAQANLVVSLSGSGNVYLPPELPLLLQLLRIESSGSGSIYVPASDLLAAEVQITATGSGAIKLGAAHQFHAASHVSINSMSSGSCRLAVADFVAQLLKVSITGSGDVTVEKVGGLNSTAAPSVSQCQYHVAGSGDLDAGVVKCSSAVAELIGSGDITLQAKDSLTYDVSGYSSIQYVGPAPLSIVSSTGKAKSDAVEPVGQSPKSKATWMDKYMLPRRRSYLAVARPGYVDIIDSGEDGVGDEDDDRETSPPSHGRSPESTSASSPSSHTRSWLVVGIVFTVVIVWNRVEAWKRKSKRRGEKAPLLGGETPVYI